VALLPLAITLFVEHALRRHHPLWLKLLGALTTAVFFSLNVFGELAARTPALLALLACMLVVLGANGMLLLQERRHEDLDEHASAVVGALLFSALASLPLAVTDFREDIPVIPVRLGGLGPLVMIYALLTIESTGRLICRWPRALLRW
jgi:hypothetical protein